jgi:hypothetical protein
LLSRRYIGRRIEESEQDSSRRPREFVAQWVIATFRCRETATIRQELFDLHGMSQTI